jgi:hypothetical protein
VWAVDRVDLPFVADEPDPNGTVWRCARDAGAGYPAAKATTYQGLMPVVTVTATEAFTTRGSD